MLSQPRDNGDRHVTVEQSSGVPLAHLRILLRYCVLRAAVELPTGDRHSELASLSIHLALPLILERGPRQEAARPQPY